MTVLDGVLTDLSAESTQLDSWVATLPASDWATVTTPEGWTVAHQIGHLHWTDQASVLAITDQPQFGRRLQDAATNARFVDDAAAELAELPVDQLLADWRAGRLALEAALRAVPDGEKIPWFGPPMNPASMATARIMETWAHGRDIADALAIDVPRTSRARHVAHIGVRARGFSHLARGEAVPADEVRVELDGPDGDTWTWGPDDAANRVTGDGVDFALLVTRRRHLDDLDVRAEGDVAAHWLTIAQSFAGPPGADPVRMADR